MADSTGRLRAPVLVAAGLAGALVVVSLLPRWGGRQGTGKPGSSFATVDEGSKAAYLMLERLGHRVERRVEPLGDLKGPRLAFVLAPQARFEQVDGEALNEWLEGGGTLVYGVSPFEPSAEVLREALQLPALRLVPVPRTTAKVVTSYAPVTDLVIHTAVSARSLVDDDDDDDEVGDSKGPQTIVAIHRGMPAVMHFARGKGGIFVIDARVFSNGGLRAGDNALFLGLLASRHSGGAPIVFDEFAHGYGDVASLMGVLAWPLRLGLGAAALALLLYALAIGRRLGAVSPDPAPPRRASIEQIEALAAFYAGKHDRQTALLALAAAAGPLDQAPLVEPADDKAFLEAAQKLRPAARPRMANDAKGSSWP